MKNKQHLDILSPELIPLKRLSFIILISLASAYSNTSCYLVDQDFGILCKLMRTRTRL